MGTFNSEELVKEIKRRLSIIDLVENYTSIKKSGNGYIGLCPFHDDSNPSMHIDEQKGLYHCFSCGAGGDIIGFYMRYNSVTFPEALTELAKKANIEIGTTQTQSPSKSKHTVLFKINSLVSKYYQAVLKQNKSTQSPGAYLEARSISDEVIDEFALGYAPEGWDNLVKFLNSKKVPLNLAEKLGLIVNKKGGDGFYDRFRNRVMFPIINIDGKVVGFGGRIIQDEEQPKYINSPESEIYKKRKNFYGLYKAREYIRREDKALLVEGYTDFLSLYSAGIKNVVATLGTSLTRDHLILLRRFTKNVVVVFDGDPAGNSAAVKSLDIFLQEGMIPYVVILPVGSDPDSFVKGVGRDKFIEMINNAPSLVDYSINRVVSGLLAGGYSLDNGLRQVVDIVQQLRGPIDRNRYIRIAAEKMGVRESDMMSLIKRGKHGGKIRNPKVSETAGSQERLLLSILLKYPELSEVVIENNAANLISVKNVKLIVDAIVTNDIRDVSKLLLHFEDVKVQELISEILMSSDFITDKQSASKMLVGCLDRMRKNKYEKDLKSLRLEIDEAIRSKDVTLEKRLLEELQELIKQK